MVPPVKVDAGIGFEAKDAAETARRAEEAGFAGIWCPETGHDPFLPLLLAGEHTEKLELGTGIAVAFARNPLSMATVANDLHLYSKGRFMLGLGSQIKPHIEKRFSMPWSHPAPRMREYVLAMRADLVRWNEGTKLAFRGEFYKHTLMTPMFSSGPEPLRHAEGLRRRSRRAHDRGGGRGRPTGSSSTGSPQNATSAT